MLNLWMILFCLILLSGCATQKTELVFEPVTLNATEEVRELLGYFYRLSGKNILSGQHNYPMALNESLDSVRAITGKRPVVWGSDFHIKQLRTEMVKEAVAKHNQGHIITLMYHQGAPVDTIPPDMNPVRYEMSEAEWHDLVTPGTRIHNNWISDIDRIAEMLQWLADRNVPVLWRPYHEMNGSWFWWCDKKGEEGIKKLWKLMFRRFTGHHRLRNLIWVWNANAPRDWENDEAYAYDLYFPGHDYVDILATDIYKGDYKQSHHDDLKALARGKPIALGECGILPTPEILERMDHFVWFMAWANFIWRVNDREDIRKVYQHERVVALDEHRSGD